MVTVEYIYKALTDAIIKCGRSNPRDSSGVIYGQGEAPQYDSNTPVPDNELLNQIADDLAERWGLEVSIDSKGKREIGQTRFSLWDERHKTLINLNKIVKRQSWIDFTNNGKGVYNIDEVFSYYNDLPDMAKERMGALFFETNKGSSFNRMYDGKYGYANTVNISSMVYKDANGTSGLRRVLGHEAGHVLDRTLTKDDVRVLEKCIVGRNKFDINKCENDAERRIANSLVSRDGLATRGQASSISFSEEYTSAKRDNKVFSASSYSATANVKGMNRNCEDFAETMSAVMFRNLKDKSGFRIRYSNGKVVDWDTFVSDHRATYKICCDYVDGKIKHNDLHNPQNGNQWSTIDEYDRDQVWLPNYAQEKLRKQDV